MRKVDLKQPYLYSGTTYGPGDGIEVPDDAYDALKHVGALEEGEKPSSSGGLEAFPEETREILVAGGFTDELSVKMASDEELLALDGIGPKRLKQIRESLAGGS